MKPILVLSALLLASGCSLAPKYQQPVPPLPPVHRGAADGVDGPSFGTLKWEQLLQDDQLQSLIRRALDQNYDVRIAAARVLEARALAGVTRADQFPTVDAAAQYTNLKLSNNGATPLPPGLATERDVSAVNGILNWELDFWGRLRNATRAARAQMLASMEAYSLVRQTLVSDLARAYFELLDLDLELEFSRRSLEVREESLRLATLRVERGVASEIDQRQAEILVKTARATMITLERLREQKENQLRLLLGENPGPVERGKGLMDQSIAVSLPVGLPSELLLNRPDIRAAEQRVIAANAQIGVARAAFFPRIALTAQAGYESASLLSILDGGNNTWVFGPTGTLPIFNAGRLRSNLRAAEARKQASVLDYQRTVQQAFRDVADSLIGQRKLAEFRLEQEGLVESLRAASRLSQSRYSNGVSSYLEFLDSERQRLDAELRLAQARRDELVAAVQLYRSLGGGWQ